MSETDLPQMPPEEWACVEIFGHRRHYGRISEAERFGAKMLRIDVPSAEPEAFDTFLYGGGSIFSVTPCTEASARAWAERDRPRPYTPSARLPAPSVFEDHDDDDPEETKDSAAINDDPGM